MPRGKGTYGSQVGRPKNSTDNYAQTKTGKGSNSTDNMNDGAIDRNLSSFLTKRTLERKMSKMNIRKKNLSNRTDEAILGKLKKSGAKMPSQHKNKPTLKTVKVKGEPQLGKGRNYGGVIGGFNYLKKKRKLN